jgi:hypothetical protein
MPYSNWLRIVGSCGVIALTAPFLGCSIHPLPGDIPRVATFDIVERIRCEAQEGLRSFPQDDPFIKKVIEGTTIGYDFNFDITEHNDVGTSTDGGHLVFQNQGRGANNFTLDLTGSLQRTRQNVRAFRIVETLKQLNKANCNREATRPNWLYPITGATGLGEVVHTFIKLEKLGALQHIHAPEGANDLTNVVFSDVLTFTTTLDLSVKPNLTLTPITGRFMLTSASITGEAKRDDTTHQVIVALARDNVNVSTAATMRMAAVREKTQALINSGALHDSREIRTLVQKDSDAYTRVLIELQRLQDLQDDDREAPRLLGEKILEILRTP